MAAHLPRGIFPRRFGFFPFRSPLLAESRLLSFPRGTEMFHFPRFAPARLCIQRVVRRHYPPWVSPFGHRRIKAWLAAPRRFSQLPTSFFASCRLGIHRVPFVAWSFFSSNHPSHREVLALMSLDRRRPGSSAVGSTTSQDATLAYLRICDCQRTAGPWARRNTSWWSRSGSNRRHPACKAGALPAEL